jgi:hypothetical protein
VVPDKSAVCLPRFRRRIYRYHGTVTRAIGENPNRAGTDACKRKDGRYETRATLNTPTGCRRVVCAKQANGVLFSDLGRVTVGAYLQSWLFDTSHYQVGERIRERCEGTCRNYLVPFFGSLRLRELTTAHLCASKARKIEEDLNPNTAGELRPR